MQGRWSSSAMIIIHLADGCAVYTSACGGAICTRVTPMHEGLARLTPPPATRSEPAQQQQTKTFSARSTQCGTVPAAVPPPLSLCLSWAFARFSRDACKVHSMHPTPPILAVGSQGFPVNSMERQSQCLAKKNGQQHDIHSQRITCTQKERVDRSLCVRVSERDMRGMMGVYEPGVAS